VNHQHDSTPETATAVPIDKETRQRRDAFACAALAALINGDPNMPTRIAVRHAWAAATQMIEAEPQ